MEPGRTRGDPWSDEELGVLALGGREEAWNEIARRHGRRVVVELLAMGFPLEQAEDLAQEVWMRLVRQQRAGRLSEVRMPGLALAQARWLGKEARRTAARRAALAEIEAAGEPDMEPTAPALDPAEQAEHREQLDRLRAELLRCPSRAQRVFRAVYEPPGRSAADVARETGLSLQRVRQILCEVRARLRTTLAQNELEEETWNT